MNFVARKVCTIASRKMIAATRLKGSDGDAMAEDVPNTGALRIGVGVKRERKIGGQDRRREAREQDEEEEAAFHPPTLRRSVVGPARKSAQCSVEE